LLVGLAVVRLGVWLPGWACGFRLEVVVVGWAPDRGELRRRVGPAPAVLGAVEGETGEDVLGC
jgi:hypothetical protein